MTLKNHALIVSVIVNKPQMTQKDVKATRDAEIANNAHNAGQFRKDLYPKTLVQPIVAVESSARAYVDSTTYPWARGEHLLPAARFMPFAERMGKFELEFNQGVTAFLNNWSNVMMQAQSNQGGLFDPTVYPDLDQLRALFRFRVMYRPVTDDTDFRVAMQEDAMQQLRETVERDTVEAYNAILSEPLTRLRAAVAKLSEATGRPTRVVVNRQGANEERPPIFRDSVVLNVVEELQLLHDFADALPDSVRAMAATVTDMLPHPNELRDNPERRAQVNKQTSALVAEIDKLLED